jgi:hypothetical protein
MYEQSFLDLTFNQRRAFIARKRGLFKKASEMGEMFKVKVQVLIESSETSRHEFLTEHKGWPPNRSEIVSIGKEL